MHRSPKLFILMSVIFFMMGITAYKYWYLNKINHPIKTYLPQICQRARCVVIQPPEYEKKYCVVKLKDLMIKGFSIKIDRSVILYTSYFMPGLLPGDIITIEKGDLTPLDEMRNPGQFDYKNFLKNKGIFAQLKMHQQSRLIIEKSTNTYILLRYTHILRQRLERIVAAFLEEDTAAFISAILLGKQNSGVAHVLAISGLHVGFIVYFFYIILSFLPVSFKWQNILLILFSLLYMGLSGMNPPVIRATIMVVIVLIGINMEYKTNVYNSLFTATFLLLVFQPQQLFNLSFQFSVTAVLSILVFYKLMKPFEELLISKIPSKKFIKIPVQKTAQLFLVSIAAQLGTLPLMAFYFRQIPVISIFLNLVVIPLVGIIIPIGFLVIICGAISPSIAPSLADLLSWLVHGLFQLVNLAANLPGAFFRISQVQGMDIGIYFLVLAIVFYYRKLKVQKLRLAATALAIIFVLSRMLPSSSNFEVLVFDVGQGSSVLISTPGNQSILYDTGPADNYTDSGKDIILPAIQHLGRLHINKVILSHPHSDHIGGIFSLAREIRIDSVYLPLLETSYSWHSKTVDFLEETQIPIRYVKMGDVIPVDPWTKIYILAPFSENLIPGNNSGKRINNVSLVCLIKSATGSVLLTGDTETDSERKILAWNELLRSQILMLGHHGSITSSSWHFLEAIAPEYGLISVGRDNHFDHPSPIILDRLHSFNIPYQRTDLSGAIWLKNIRGSWKTVDWRVDN
jgi:competence protein ComEC